MASFSGSEIRQVDTSNFPGYGTYNFILWQVYSFSGSEMMDTIVPPEGGIDPSTIKVKIWNGSDWVLAPTE